MHWEQTVFNTEIMTTELVRTDNIISKITLSYFLDSNWYADVNLKSGEDLLVIIMIFKKIKNNLS